MWKHKDEIEEHETKVFVVKDFHVFNMLCQTSISNNNIDILEWEHEVEERETKVICC
jgi:hypothetical protein